MEYTLYSGDIYSGTVLEQSELHRNLPSHDFAIKHTETEVGEFKYYCSTAFYGGSFSQSSPGISVFFIGELVIISYELFI